MFDFLLMSGDITRGQLRAQVCFGLEGGGSIAVVLGLAGDDSGRIASVTAGSIPVGTVCVHRQGAGDEERDRRENACQQPLERGHEITSSSGENWKSARWLRCMIQMGYGSM